MNIFKKIINYIKLRFISSTVLDNPLSAPTAPSSVQENSRDKNTVKRVIKAFKEQQQAMQARALKPHDPTCSDPLTCEKISCFIREPDKKVGKHVIVPIPKDRQVDASMGVYQKPKRRMRKTTSSRTTSSRTCAKKIST